MHFQKNREPHRLNRTRLLRIQLHKDPPYPSRHTRHGRWRHGPPLGGKCLAAQWEADERGVRKSGVDLLIAAAGVFAADGPKIVNEGYGDFLPVPAGAFKTGGSLGDGESRERPVHQVTLDAFYIGKFEVTNADWKMRNRGKRSRS